MPYINKLDPGDGKLHCIDRRWRVLANNGVFNEPRGNDEVQNEVNGRHRKHEAGYSNNAKVAGGARALITSKSKC